ncbi:AMP-binding protein [Pseudomonas sp. H11T01]|uniref:AMP-binding protein n=1 Tax=Pseudomonas sp. H11T01 TaxID=3402749 RepID=UPI003AC5853F
MENSYAFLGKHLLDFGSLYSNFSRHYVHQVISFPRVSAMPTKTVSLPTQFNDATTLHAVFARVSQQYPHDIAVTDGQTQLTYRELNERAEKLAISLRNVGVKRDQLVGLCLE